MQGSSDQLRKIRRVQAAIEEVRKCMLIVEQKSRECILELTERLESMDLLYDLQEYADLVSSDARCTIEQAERHFCARFMEWRRSMLQQIKTHSVDSQDRTQLLQIQDALHNYIQFTEDYMSSGLPLRPEMRQWWLGTEASRDKDNTDELDSVAEQYRLRINSSVPQDQQSPMRFATNQNETEHCALVFLREKLESSRDVILRSLIRYTASTHDVYRGLALPEDVRPFLQPCIDKLNELGEAIEFYISAVNDR